MTRSLAILLLAMTFTAAVEPLPDAAMGDWSAEGALAVQVIPLGKGEYRALVFPTFAQGDAPLAVMAGTGKDSQVSFDGKTPLTNEGKSWWPAPAGSESWSGSIVNGVFTLNQPGKPAAALKPVDRSSPTLGAKPPVGAVVLLGSDTTDLNQTWGKFKASEYAKKGTPGSAEGPCPWALEPGGVMRCVPKKGDIATLKTFGDCHLHLEFNLAFEPTNRGQDRSNSGVFFQERYELQVLDSYGLKGLINEAGALYLAQAPKVNACLPPGRWQTYDVDFTAAKVDGDTLIAGAMFIAHLNGILVQENTKLTKPTGNRAKNTLTNLPGPFLLQDHDHPVAYRNIWLTETR